MPKLHEEKVNVLKKPEWLKIRLHRTAEYADVQRIVRDHSLHTICSSGLCPNKAECWSRRTATFMILGEICTRNCRFCATLSGRPLPPDPSEPAKLAESVRLMGLRHVVVTSVTRDDLPDGGAAHWAECVRAIRAENPDVTIELLIPDLDAKPDLLDTVIAVYENEDDRVRHIHINQGPVIEESLRTITGALKESRELPPQFPPRYIAMKLLEEDSYIKDQLKHHPKYPEWEEASKREAQRIKNLLDEDIETAFADQKYGFISGALRETYTPGKKEQTQVTKIIDAFVTHKLWGFPIFFFLMWLMFYCTFNLGAYPQERIEQLVGLIGQGVDAWMPDGALKDLLVDGVIGGVGSVIVFLPNIMILYLFIAFMEDSGYLARAAFIMDRIMHRIGLHGKSFIPLIMGFGCNVPAIMATRTIESRSSRLITVLLVPFMSCSARIPIYILLIGTFFAAYASWVMLGLYLLGIVVAVITARLMRRYLFKKDETPFVMELPPYRVPTMRATLSHMWDRCAQYLRKMGGLILIASVAVWFLSYYPTPDAAAPAETMEEHYENSYLGQVGQACSPVFEPLGLNWKASIAILTGLPAKEIVVSTLGVLYSEQGDAPEAELDSPTLSQRLVASGDFTPASALAFLVFILLYLPCIATIVAIAAEIGWRWACISVLYNTALAWIMAYLTYHLFSWL